MKYMLALVSDTYYYEDMPNKRKDNIKRVTVTIDEKLLDDMEAYCERLGVNRLDFIRDAIQEELAKSKGKKQTIDTNK